jgi:SH3-like domain-containing protein
MRITVKIIALLALTLTCAVGAFAEQLEISENANIRAKPEKKSASLGSVPKGALVPILERHESWYKIEYNDMQGWVYNKLASERANVSEIFTKQDMSLLPAAVDSDEIDTIPVLYAMALQDNTHILAYLDPQAPILHTARKGEWFILIAEGKSGVWCKVVYRDTSGWIQKTKNSKPLLKILNYEPDPWKEIGVKESKTPAFAVLAIIAVCLIVVAIVTIRHIKTERMRNVHVRENALILAKESKHVQYTLTNTTATMERCFAEIGFNVAVVKDSVTARNNIENSMPDIILVDWNFETAILAKIDNLFARMTLPAMPHFLFYNVPDPTAAQPCKVLRNVNFLGITVVDRDIFKIVTPLLVHKAEAEQSAKDAQKGLQRCALEGEIAGGNLLEVLQFIEVGSKTGCLMVETRGPFGLVYFSDGRIVYAAAKGPGGEPIYGVEGVYEILNQQMGKFRFITNKQPKAANLNLPTLSVLMEWTKEKDESGRG